MRDKEFSNIVSERFEDFGETPADAVWANIEGSLDEDKKRRRVIIWWSLAAVLALSVLTVGIISTGDDDAPLNSSNSSKN